MGAFLLPALGEVVKSALVAGGGYLATKKIIEDPKMAEQVSGFIKDVANVKGMADFAGQQIEMIANPFIKSFEKSKLDAANTAISDTMNKQVQDFMTKSVTYRGGATLPGPLDQPAPDKPEPLVFPEVSQVMERIIFPGRQEEPKPLPPTSGIPQGKPEVRGPEAAPQSDPLITAEGGLEEEAKKYKSAEEFAYDSRLSQPWSGVVDLRDGVVEKTFTEQKNLNASYNHSFLVSDSDQEAINAGEKAYFWLSPDGTPMSMELNLSKTIQKKIKEQLGVGDKVKTEKQFIDIWNKAHGEKAQPTKVEDKPLITRPESGFYTKAEEAVLKQPQELMTAQQAKALVTKQGKKDDVDPAKLDAFLADNPKVSKVDLAGFIRDNQPKINVQVRRAEGQQGPQDIPVEIGRLEEQGANIFNMLEAGALDEDPEAYQHAQQQLLGIENNIRGLEDIQSHRNEITVEREQLRALREDKNNQLRAMQSSDEDADYEEDFIMDDIKSIDIRMDEIAAELAGNTNNLPVLWNRPSLVLPGGEDYQETYFSLPESTVGEYYNHSNPELPNTFSHLRTDVRSIDKKGDTLFQQEAQNYNTSYDRVTKEQIDANPTFTSTGSELFLLKQMLEKAVAEDKDYISWTTGDQQAERTNNLLKDIEKIQVWKNANGTFSYDVWKDGAVVDRKSGIEKDKLKVHIGVPAASEALEGIDKQVAEGLDTPAEQLKRAKAWAQSEEGRWTAHTQEMNRAEEVAGRGLNPEINREEREEALEEMAMNNFARPFDELDAETQADLERIYDEEREIDPDGQIGRFNEPPDFANELIDEIETGHSAISERSTLATSASRLNHVVNGPITIGGKLKYRYDVTKPKVYNKYIKTLDSKAKIEERPMNTQEKHWAETSIRGQKILIKRNSGSHADEVVKEFEPGQEKEAQIFLDRINAKKYMQPVIKLTPKMKDTIKKKGQTLSSLDNDENIMKIFAA